MSPLDQARMTAIEQKLADIEEKVQASTSSSTKTVKNNTSHTSYVTDTAYTQVASQAKYEIMAANASANTYGGIASTKIGLGARVWTELGVLSSSTDLTAVKVNFSAGPSKSYLNFHAVEETVNSAVQTEINNVRDEVAAAVLETLASTTALIAESTKTVMSEVNSLGSKIDNTANKVDNVASATKRGLLASKYLSQDNSTVAMMCVNSAMTVMS
ncbi:hypothetical protein [Piscirickettsia litoralis]|nr:hypothetical protein [Piscirickettsia litoralis]